jgi:hypothetical protein
MVSRWKKSKQYAYRMNDVRNELNLSKPLNKIFRYICSLEVHWLQKGFSLPIGGSLLCVARKKKI